MGLLALGDLDGCLGRVEHALRGLETQGASGKTRANYAGALQGFCSWALRRRYLAEHPLQEFVLPDTTRQTTWRDFTLAEIQRLLDHCAPHRRLLYEVTLFSGLRRNELRQLALEHLDMEHSGLRLGTFTKNRQALFHPLPKDLVERLYAHAVSGEPNRVYMSRSRDEVPRDVPLAPLLYVPVGTARDLAQDLAAAGIPLVTEHGKAVFHSLRITYINLVLDLGVNPKEAQQLARHSTVNLTMNVYGRTRSEYLSGVVERLYESVCATFVQLSGVEEPLALAVGGDVGMPKGGFEPIRHLNSTQPSSTQRQHLSTLKHPAPLRSTSVKHPSNIVSQPSCASRVQHQAEGQPYENLAKVVAAWPDLRPEDKQRILAIVEEGGMC